MQSLNALDLIISTPLPSISTFSKFSLNIRIDTHHDNVVMQRLLKKLGFQYCGIIHLENGDPRLAFQYEKNGAGVK
mgnify:CR=1 FL=1